MATDRSLRNGMTVLAIFLRLLELLLVGLARLERCPFALQGLGLIFKMDEQLEDPSKLGLGDALQNGGTNSCCDGIVNAHPRCTGRQGGEAEHGTAPAGRGARTASW
mmetsp:Transcript_17397/g.14115  ORF Transcript_17397/g.14115 Transcript_17397/m.14115 type:complete len:107 (+) Transcript_17397:305-625(+)